MASDATVTVDDEVSTTPARLVAAGAGRPDIVKQVTGAARVANALAQVAEDVVEGGLQGVVTSRPYTVAVLSNPRGKACVPVHSACAAHADQPLRSSRSLTG